MAQLSRLPVRLLIGSAITLVLAGSLFADSYAFSPVVESTITVKSKETDCNPIMQATDLSVFVDGEVKSNAPLGSQVSVQATVAGDCEVNSNFVVLEIRDAEEATTYLAYQNITSQEKQVTASFSWLADETGDYTIRIFSFQCPSCRGPLGSIKEADFAIS